MAKAKPTATKKRPKAAKSPGPAESAQGKAAQGKAAPGKWAGAIRAAWRKMGRRARTKDVVAALSAKGLSVTLSEAIQVREQVFKRRPKVGSLGSTSAATNVPGALSGYILVFVEESLSNGRDICIYGDPDGLRSLGEALIAVGNLDQKALPDGNCPPEESFHRHYRTGRRLPTLTVGRVDRKESGETKPYFADHME